MFVFKAHEGLAVDLASCAACAGEWCGPAKAAPVVLVQGCGLDALSLMALINTPLWFVCLTGREGGQVTAQEEAKTGQRHQGIFLPRPRPLLLSTFLPWLQQI